MLLSSFKKLCIPFCFVHIKPSVPPCGFTSTRIPFSTRIGGGVGHHVTDTHWHNNSRVSATTNQHSAPTSSLRASEHLRRVQRAGDHQTQILPHTRVWAGTSTVCMLKLYLGAPPWIWAKMSWSQYWLSERNLNLTPGLGLLSFWANQAVMLNSTVIKNNLHFFAWTCLVWKYCPPEAMSFWA